MASYLYLYARDLIAHLQEKGGVAIEPGLTDVEVKAVQDKYGFSFPADLRAILQTGLPVGKGFLDWRNAPEQTIRQILASPMDMVAADVNEGRLWCSSWGPRSTNKSKKFSFFRKKSKGPVASDVVVQAMQDAPVMIPVFGNCFIPSKPYDEGNPLFQCKGADTVICANDIPSLFAEDVLGPQGLQDQYQRKKSTLPKPSWAASSPKNISFWTEITEWRTQTPVEPPPTPPLPVPKKASSSTEKKKKGSTPAAPQPIPVKQEAPPPEPKKPEVEEDDDDDIASRVEKAAALFSASPLYSHSTSPSSSPGRTARSALSSGAPSPKTSYTDSAPSGFPPRRASEGSLAQKVDGGYSPFSDSFSSSASHRPAPAPPASKDRRQSPSHVRHTNGTGSVSSTYIPPSPAVDSSPFSTSSSYSNDYKPVAPQRRAPEPPPKVADPFSVSPFGNTPSAPVHTSKPAAKAASPFDSSPFGPAAAVENRRPSSTSSYGGSHQERHVPTRASSQGGMWGNETTRVVPVPYNDDDITSRIFKDDDGWGGYGEGRVEREKVSAPRSNGYGNSGHGNAARNGHGYGSWGGPQSRASEAAPQAVRKVLVNGKWVVDEDQN